MKILSFTFHSQHEVPMKFKFRFIPALLVLFGISLPAFAQGNADAIISYRKNVMKAVGGNTGALFTIVKGGLGDYKDQMLYRAKALHESAQSIPAIYPEGTGTGKTRAKAEIWPQREAFIAVVDDMAKAAENLIRIAESGELRNFHRHSDPSANPAKTVTTNSAKDAEIPDSDSAGIVPFHRVGGSFSKNAKS